MGGFFYIYVYYDAFSKLGPLCFELWYPFVFFCLTTVARISINMLHKICEARFIGSSL